MKSPPTDDEQRADALLRAIAAARRADRAAAPMGASTDADAGADAQKEDQKLVQTIVARVVAQRNEQPSPAAHIPRRRVHHGVGWAAAIALALVLGIATRSTPDAMLPDYSLETAGLDQSMRSTVAADGPAERVLPKVSLGNRLVLSLRPQDAVDARVIGELWLASPPAATLLPTAVTVSAQGALRVDAVVGSGIDLGTGRHRLWLVARVPQMATPALRLLESPAEIVEPGLHGVAIDIEIVATDGQVP